MPEESFFIEKPRDELGNRGGPFAVIKGYIDEEHKTLLNVIEPLDYKWNQVGLRFFVRVSDEAGPARYIKIDDLSEKSENDILDELIEKYKIEE